MGMEVYLMPAAEVDATSGGTASEDAIPADDSENLYGAGPYNIGRYSVNLTAQEVTMNPQ